MYGGVGGGEGMEMVKMQGFLCSKKLECRIFPAPEVFVIYFWADTMDLISPQASLLCRKHGRKFFQDVTSCFCFNQDTNLQEKSY